MSKYRVITEVGAAPNGNMVYHVSSMNGAYDYFVYQYNSDTYHFMTGDSLRVFPIEVSWEDIKDATIQETAELVAKYKVDFDVFVEVISAGIEIRRMVCEARITPRRRRRPRPNLADNNTFSGDLEE